MVGREKRALPRLELPRLACGQAQKTVGEEDERGAERLFQSRQGRGHGQERGRRESGKRRRSARELGKEETGDEGGGERDRR
jgi:hypothetical protein